MEVKTMKPWEFALLAIIIVFHSATTDDTTTEIPMTWNTLAEDESSTMIHASLPTEIFLDLRDVTKGHEHSRLRLVKKADDVEHVQVITRHRGRERDWKMRRHEHFSVYSDQSTHASFSVSIDDRDATKMMMFGSFMLGKDAFSLSPLKHSFSESGQVISINGSLHVLTVEEHSPEALNFDNLGERSYYDYEYGEDYNYILAKSAFMTNKEVYKRRPNVKQNLTVELFVVLDYSIYKKWLDHSRGNADAAISGLRFYYAHILNGMNDRYEAIDNPDFKISIKPAGYYLARSRSDAPFTEDSHIKLNSSSIQAYKALDNFYRWIMRRVRYQNKDLPRFDASALFTDYVLMASDTGSRSISGLADIGAVCKVNAVSINKDFGQYGTIDTATHELGHNLGALHDGSNNTCSTNDQFIMASSPFSTHDSLFFNPYKFSTCSIKYLKDHFEKLNSLGRNCLLDGVSSSEDHKSHLSELPGQKFTLDEQCQILFGKDSFYCAGGGDHGKAICRSMFCWKPVTKTCMTDVRMRAADGTPCHNKSWCIGSKCVADSRAPVMEDVSCPHGDFKDKIPFWNSGQITCKDIETNVPHLCYHTYYENLCCETCKKMKRSVTDCEYGDRNKTACAVIPTNYCYDKSMKHECCETCKKREDESAEEDCKFGDKVTWCSNQIHFKSSGCYRAGDKKLCCKTCQNFEIGPPGCEYGDRGEGCKKDHCQSESHRLYCCKTCGLDKDFLEPSLNLSTTTTTIRPTTKTTNLQTNLKCSKDSASWCARIKPSECYRSSETCCYTCQQYFNPGKAGCEYGDKKESCSPDKCSRGNWYLENCCYSCEAYLTTSTSTTKTTTTTTTTTKIPTTTRSTTPFTTTKLTSTFQTTTPTTTTTKAHPKCPRGDMARWCSGIKPNECYRSAHICCLTCLEYLDESSKDCSYGDRRSDCKLSHCTSYLKYDCCKTCSNFVPTTTPKITAAPTTKSNAILEVLSVDIKNCRRDKQAWCVQMSPHECYLYSVECCATCSGFYNESFKGCEFGDRESMCAPSACKDSSYSKICCKTCNHASADLSQMKLVTKTTPTSTTRPISTTFTISTTTRTTPTTITTSTTSGTTANQKCPRGDLASWCSTIKSYDCYTSAHLCCSTCLQYLDESSKDCRYGNRRSDCEASKCDRVYNYYCCRTCMNATATTTTTSTTTTTRATASTTTTTKTVYDVDIPKKTPSWNDVIDEDPKTQCPNGDLASWCPSIKPYDCYKSSKICCATCLKYYDKSADYDCEYGDKVSWCENHVRKSAEDCKRPSSSVATKCCKSCKEAFLDDPEYHIKFSYVRPTCSHGDEASFCQNIEPSSCYNNYRTCCRTCAAYFDSTIPECPYGDKADWCKKHATSAESCNRKDIASRCCHTCFYLTSNGNITQSVGTCDDIADWCKTLVARQCYQSRAEFTCCSTCRRLRKNRTGDCRYGNHVSWCGPQYCSSYSDECCETCA